MVVVNDNSADGTEDYLNNIKDNKYKIINSNIQLGKSGARNKGIENALGDIIAFTDDDIIVSSDWLTELTKPFDDDKVGFVIGETKYRQDGYRGYFPERIVTNKNAQWPSAGNIAYKKEALNKTGMFDNSFDKYNNEDTELGIRAVSKGYKFHRSTDAIVYHQETHWTVKSLLNTARNASVMVKMKKLYPYYYRSFSPKVLWGAVLDPLDYLFILFLPITLPILLFRYLMHGKNDLMLFFTKWPILIIMKRLYIYLEAIKNKTLLI